MSRFKIFYTVVKTGGTKVTFVNADSLEEATLYGKDTFPTFLRCEKHNPSYLKK